MKAMQLSEYSNVKSKNLSYGNKRKLSICMSLLCGSSVQFLDEPSTGLDPIAKRFFWQTLKTNVEKRNLSVILSTHSMSEAESLSDKIGILVNGELQCTGSPDRLISQYLNSYRLTMKMISGVDPEQIHNYIINNLRAQKLESNFPNSLVYEINKNYFQFSYVFTLLENIKDHLISDYSLHQTNLEQIFQKFADYQYNYFEPPKSKAIQELCNCQGLNCLKLGISVICCCFW